MTLNTKIFVAGHRGLVGGAIVKELQKQGYKNILTRDRKQLDLEDKKATTAFFEQEKPEVVFLAAAKVGGILANRSLPVDFLMKNLNIETNIFEAAHQAKVQRLIFLGSSCVYPRDSQVPIKEEYLLTGPLEFTNRPYALAKIAGIEMCWAYNRQFGTKWLSAMPTNMYGPGDNYDLQGSHVIAALIRRIHEAKESGAPEVILWGSGKPKREFLYNDDLAAALVFLAALDEERYSRLTDPEKCPLINIGTGEDITITELATTIAKTLGYNGRFSYDTSMPDGTMRKVMDVSKIKSLGWEPKIALADGIKKAHADFLEQIQR